MFDWSGCYLADVNIPTCRVQFVKPCNDRVFCDFLMIWFHILHLDMHKQLNLFTYENTCLHCNATLNGLCAECSHFFGHILT